MLLQSFNGIPVRVSARYVPLTSTLKETLNNMAGTDLYKVRKETHGEIAWTPEVLEPAKPRRKTCIDEPRARDEWTQQSSGLREAFRKPADCPEYILRGHLYSAKLVHQEERSYSRHGRNDKYKDRRRVNVRF
jgi:hypothetical protein